MLRQLKRLVLASAIFSGVALLATPVTFADPGNGNSANAPGRTTAAASITAQSNNNAATQTQAVTGSGTANTSTQTSSQSHNQGNAGTSGTVVQPQPYSKADQNNTGANTTSSTNPYKSTSNGSPSLNGNGNGKATGKPCAGCVGKADNKFPPGQAPGGSDRNKGYECDKNNGIGKSNPAHTGCTSAPVLCLTNCGGKGGGGSSGCITNCSSNNQCTTNCPQTLTTLMGGRGGDGQVLGIATTVAGVLGAAMGNLLPNTGARDPLNLWAMAAVVGFVLALIYWRQLVQPHLSKG